MKKALSFLLLIVLLISFTIPAFANEDAGISIFIQQIENAKMQEAGVSTVQELIDKLAEKPASGSEWWILSIRNSKENLDYSLYREALEKYVQETPPSSATSKERIALTLLSLNSGSSYPEEIVDSAIESGSINAYIYGLHLVNNGAKSKYSKGELVSKILELQCSDGGFSLNGQTGDPDITAMVLQVLAVNYSEPGVSVATEKALSYLSSAQLENGGYKSYGNENPESPAQVIMALSSLGIDAKEDERFIKNGNTLFDAIESFKIDEGIYSHTTGGDENSTAQLQVYYSYVSYQMFKENGTKFYDFEPLSEKLIERKEEKENSEINIKSILYIVLAAGCALVCLVKYLKGERKLKAFISIILIFGILALALCFIKIESSEEYYKKSEIEHPIFTTISIYCDTIKGEKDYIPADGKILEYKAIQVEDGASVYEQLVEACKEYELQLESDGDSYVNSINNIYEYDFGDLSGWMFKVNGEFSDVGCNQKKLKDGDYVEWVYTKDLGKDVGNENMN